MLARYLLPACALAIAILSGVAYCEGRKAGEAKFASEARADTIALLRQQHESAAARERIDTVRLTARETRYVTLRDTIFRNRTDTLISIDTVRLLVAAADSTIKACRVTVRDCEVRADAAEGIVRQQAKQIAALEHKTTHWYSRIGICGGYGLTATPSGAVVHGAQLGACIRVWP